MQIDAGAATTTLLIVRHGETVWNAEGRMQGQLDIELNETGRSQARRVAEAFKKLGLADQIDAVVSSDLSRASQTADAIAEICPHAQRRKDAGLREVNMGKLQGTLSSDPENVNTKKKVAGAWCRADFSAGYPQGESGSAVIARGLQSLRSAAELGSCVVVVAHGGLIKWSAIGLELVDGDTDGWAAASAAGAAGQQKMAQPRLQEILKAPVRNCCCSTVLYDRQARRFRAVRWFEDLSADDQARDDTG